MPQKIFDRETGEMSKINVDLSALPDGWAETTIGEIIEPSKEKVNPLEIKAVPYISLEHIEKDTGKLLGHGSSTDVRSSKTKFTRGDLLYGKLRPYLNKVYISDFEGVCSTDLLVFPKKELLSNTFFLYRFLCRDFVNYTSHNVSGVNLPRVNFQTLSQFKILLPPLSEQNRIVAKIEELFTKLDAGKEELLQARARLKRYRQSVLKAAMDGKLTEDWRKKHGNEIVPASVLLDRVLKERREKWEAEQLEQMMIKGKMPKDDKWKNKYKEPPGPDTSKLSELPEGWVWTNIQQLSKVSGGLTKNSKRNTYPKKLPYLRVANVYAHELRLEEIKDIGVKKEELNRVLLKDGDMLVVEGNGSPDQIGRVAIWNGSISPCAHQNHIIKARFDPVEIGMYCIYWLLSIEGRKYISQVASSTSGLYTLSISKVQALPVPIPPLREQQVIIEEIDRYLSVADAVEAVVDAELKRSDALRQSILKQAFSGQLVPQDPNDEPAEKLLARIKKEKAKRETAQNRKGKKQLALFEH